MYFTISLSKQKKDRYRELMLKYGVITLLYVMQDHELNENYEECLLIKEAIEETNNALRKRMGDIDILPTTLQGLNVKHFIDSAYKAFSDMSYNGTFTAESFFTNLDYYIEQVKLEINKLNK